MYGMWAYLSTFSRIWAFISKLGSGSGTGSASNKNLNPNPHQSDADPPHWCECGTTVQKVACFRLAPRTPPPYPPILYSSSSRAWLTARRIPSSCEVRGMIPRGAGRRRLRLRTGGRGCSRAAAWSTPTPAQVGQYQAPWGTLASAGLRQSMW